MKLNILKYSPLIDPNEMYLACGIPRKFGFGKTTPEQMIKNAITMYKPNYNYLFILKR
jgi:hypothetical protein